MTNVFYNPSGNPAQNAEGLSSLIRAEFAAIGTAFDAMPQISTTGVFSTVFNQVGNYTFTLPGAPGTLAMLSDVAGETTRATAVEVVVATAVSAETTRATAAEALLAPKAAPALTGAATLNASQIQTVSTLASPPAIGGTAAAPGAFTALNAASGNVFSTIGRNRVDNGDFEVAQRNLPVTVSGAYALDRWTVGWTAGTGSVAQGSTAGYSSRKQLYGVFTGLTAGAIVNIQHRIEAARSYDLAGTTVTLQLNTSYTVTAGSTTFAVQPYYANSLDTFSSPTAIGSPLSFVPSGSPGTYSVTFAVPSAATNGLSFNITATQATATGTLTWNLTSVQLEAGSVATTFERPDPPLSFLRCRKFFRKSYSRGTAIGTTFTASAATVLSSANSSGAVWDHVGFDTPMHHVPSITAYDGAGTAASVTYYNPTVWTNGGAFSLKAASDNAFSWSSTSGVLAAFEYTAMADL